MRYRGVRPAQEREKNKTKVYAVIVKNPDIILDDLIELAKPLAKNTVTECVHELVNDGIETVELLKKGIAISNIKRKYVIELKAGKRKIYRVFGLPFSSLVNQSFLLNQHKGMEYFVNCMTESGYRDLPLKQKIEFAQSWVLNPICNILWDLITNDIENSTKYRFSKEIQECRKRISKVFNIVKNDQDADKILPYLRATMMRESLKLSAEELKYCDFSNLVRLQDSS